MDMRMRKCMRHERRNVYVNENSLCIPVDNGGQVTVFLLDTSVQMNHREIEGKVMVTDLV